MSENDVKPQSSIDQYVMPYIESLPRLDGKVAVDIPSGEGRASYMFAQRGADVRAFDLYPEFTTVEGVETEFADLNDRIPLEDASADYLICQEGIEHLPNKVDLLAEFNRVLKPGGTLILTTPNFSSARVRFWMLLAESDSGRRMPVSEIDSIWFSEKRSDRLYFGHLFVIGVQPLQTLCRISGFEVVERRRTAWSTSAIVFGLLIYPFAIVGSLLAYLRYSRANRHVDEATRRSILWDRLKLNLSPQTLFGKHIFWVLRKTADTDECVEELKSLVGS